MIGPFRTMMFLRRTCLLSKPIWPKVVVSVSSMPSKKIPGRRFILVGLGRVWAGATVEHACHRFCKSTRFRHWMRCSMPTCAVWQSVCMLWQWMGANKAHAHVTVIIVLRLQSTCSLYWHLCRDLRQCRISADVVTSKYRELNTITLSKPLTTVFLIVVWGQFKDKCYTGNND